MFDSSLTTPTCSYYTQSNLQGNYRHTEIYNALKTKILEYLQDALISTKKLFTLTGQNIFIDNHILVLVANLYKIITG